MTAAQGPTGTASPHHAWWQVVALVSVSTLAILAGTAFDRTMEKYLPESRSFPSTFNKRSSGYSGLFEITNNVGLPARRWQLPYRRLKGVRGVLVMVQPDKSLTSFEVGQVADWVEQGNTLIYFDHFIFSFERQLIKKLGIDAHVQSGLEEAVVPAKGSRPELAHVPAIIVTAENRLSGGTPLVSDSSGALLAEISYGKGRAIVGVMPNLCANRRLMSESDWKNFQLMVNLFRTAGGEVLFDEYCHGRTASTNVFVHLARGPAGFLCFQALLLTFVAFLSHAQRFGSTAVLPITRRISNLEFVNGLANTYRRARANDLIWEIIGHASRARWLRALGISPHEPDEKLIWAWSEQSGGSPAEIEELLSRSSRALESKKLADEELVALVGSCDKITERARNLLASRKGIAS
jgi:hypothetical protein